jgi:hypothetical protein
MPSETPLTGVRLPPELKAQAQEFALLRGVSLTALVCIALSEYLEAHGRGLYAGERPAATVDDVDALAKGIAEKVRGGPAVKGLPRKVHRPGRRV